MREDIYQGCTVPPMLFGVPLLPFILGTLAFALVGLYDFILFGLPGIAVLVILYAFLFAWARRESKNDDFRLLQLLMKLQMRGSQSRSRRYWGSATYTPHQKTGAK